MKTALRVGIVTAYPDDDWHSQQLIEAVQAYGQPVIIRPESIGARLTASGVALMTAEHDIGALDGYVLARGFSERGNSDFLVPVYQYLARRGKVMVNTIDALLTAIDKFETSCLLQEAGIPTPPVVVAQDDALGRQVLAEWERVVAKPIYGSLGLGIELLRDDAEGRAMIGVLLERFGAVYLQQFVETPGRDIRAFVVGTRVAASIYRVATPGNWRTNVHQGGQPLVCTLDAHTASLAVAAAQAVGLDYTGVDILEGPDGPVVIEVNGNPLWLGVLQATGRNMADEIVAWVAERIQQQTMKGGERGAERDEERRYDRSRGWA